MKTIKQHINTIICGDALEVVKTFPDESIDCVVTSPPYWQLRNYGWKGQWGLEKTYMEYLENLWALMDEIRRILKPSGTVWVVLGDTYFGSGNDSYKSKEGISQNRKNRKVGKVSPAKANTYPANKLKRKCLSLIPHRFAIGCIERGWIVRNDIIWAKQNAMPGSIKDRFSKLHEYLFFMVRNQRYFFDMDSIREPYAETTAIRAKYPMVAIGQEKKIRGGKGMKQGSMGKSMQLNPKGKNPGSVSDFWKIPVRGSHDKHYAQFSNALIEKPILAGCPKGGIVLDPFCGLGTTCLTAKENGRKYIGIDGSKAYCKQARDLLKQENLNGLEGTYNRQPSWYRARMDVIADFIMETREKIDKAESEAQRKRLQQDLVLLRNGVIPDSFQMQLDKAIQFALQQKGFEHVNQPLEFREITRYNTYFTMHPERVAGEEITTTSRDFPVQIKGAKEDIIRVIEAQLPKQKPSALELEAEAIALRLQLLDFDLKQSA